MIAGKDWKVTVGLMDPMETKFTVWNISCADAESIRTDVAAKNASFATIECAKGKVFSVNRAHVSYVSVERMP